MSHQAASDCLLWCSFHWPGHATRPSKIQALQDLPAPDLQTKLQSFLGLINYLQPFIPGLSSKTTFLQEQLSQWDWNPSTDSAFQHLKAWICQTLLKVTVAYYDRTKPVMIQTIAFASKSLTDVESCCANIERECLSVCFGLEKFHTYIYGRHVLIENDHKLLEMIQHKPIHMAPPRLQQMLLCMQKYDFTIVYKPGKDMVLADCLSCFPSYTNYLPIPLVHNIQHVQLSTSELDVIRGAVECDPVYSTVYRLTLRGWPDRVQDVPHVARHFWGARDELSIDQGLLLKGTRVCIPPELLERTLADLHGAHQGVDRMQAQAREAVYWPGIDSDISDYVSQCTTCTKHKASPPAQPMLPRDIPDGPWQDIAVDYMTFKGHEYLIICNTFSKYPFAYKVTAKSAQSLHLHLLKLISQYGPPMSLSTDNGPPFASDELTEFLTHHHIAHHTSSPHFPRSNGFIERQVRTIKTALHTALPAKKSLESVLLDLRSTPIRSNMPAPHEILHNRTIQQPGRPSQLVDMEMIRNFLISKWQAQCDQFNKAHGVRALPELPPGQEVLLRSPASDEYIPGPSLRRHLCHGATSSKHRAKSIAEQENMCSQSI